MSQYDASDMEVLRDLAPIQKRPGMYTDTQNPTHTLMEIVDNAVDEAQNGYANSIDVTLFKDGRYGVLDNGRGIPVDIHPEEKISGVELILETPHSGGKFSNKNYGFSGGLHGVGVTVVNALSKYLLARVRRNGQTHEITYVNAVKQGPLTAILNGRVNKKNTGTYLEFIPDEQYYASVNVDKERLTALLRTKALLCPGLRIKLHDERLENTTTFFFESGVDDFIAEQVNYETAIPDGTFKTAMDFFFDKEQKSPGQFALWCYFTESASLNHSYVNLIPTPQSGTHVNALKSAIFDSVNEYATTHDLLPKKKKFQLSTVDVWGTVNFVLSIKMHDPDFAGQTKEKLRMPSSKSSLLSRHIKDAFVIWMTQNPTVSEAIVTMVVKKANKRLREQEKVERKALDGPMALPGKLVDCDSEDPMDSEIFLVEGDSAGGSAKQARNRRNQAIMPLRGKIQNTWEVRSDVVLSSDEISNIASAIGVDPGNEDISGLRYGKICILADADSDGLHIASLLTCLFIKHFLPIVEAGHLYMAMPPLYRIDIGKETFYALDEIEKDRVINEAKRRGSRAQPYTQRFKGLGEMNPEQLDETTLNPASRRLVQITVNDKERLMEHMDMLLAKRRSHDRFNWLKDNGDQFETELL
ncbi:DNA topoisomerase IV subunit B [Alteromonas sp. 14N.309.X.WAT.G.H12]|uniref:DNA topoisomerase IV subunit B n=1 Tax=Alteromonas sp. 14N.309.X.WAT.G.H12 TaxID=3120824 RepID=UPI002FD5BB69